MIRQCVACLWLSCSCSSRRRRLRRREPEIRTDPVEATRIYRALNRTQRNTFLACFLGWTLDALDFFLLTFVLGSVATEFGRTIPEMTFAITLTLLMRPLG